MDFRFGILDGRGGLGGFGRQGDRFWILDFGFGIEEGDWEVLGVRAEDLGLSRKLGLKPCPSRTALIS